MGVLPVPDGLTEAEIALFALVATLERDDYRSASGVPAITTQAYLEAKALVCLLALLGGGAGPRH